jgi:ParB family chromosome partitioning protein
VARPSGLGKGLNALIPVGGSDEPPTSDGSGLRMIPISSIVPNPNQPRVHFDEAALEDLAKSISAIGVLQPILVRPSNGGYELIAGERRWRAATSAGLSEIPAVVKVTDDMSSTEQALVENLHRQDLTALEEAAAYRQLLDDFSLTHDQVATRVGKSRSAISNALRLLTLPASIQEVLADGRLSAGHARAILGVSDRSTQERLAKEAVARQWSVREVEDAVRSAADESVDPKKKRRGGGTQQLREPGLLELEQLLGEHLSTTVSVTMSGKRGKVTIEFADLEDLERIYNAMTEPPLE